MTYVSSTIIHFLFVKYVLSKCENCIKKEFLLSLVVGPGGNH